MRLLARDYAGLELTFGTIILDEAKDHLAKDHVGERMKGGRILIRLGAGDFLGQAVIGSQWLNSGPYQQAYLVKYDRQGRPVWVRQNEAQTYSMALRLELDRFGRVFLLGERGGSLPGEPEIAYSHLFLASYDRDGRPRWAQDFGSDTLRMWSTFSVDRRGDCFVVGSFQETLAFGDTLLSSRGSRDFFLARFGR